MKPLLITTLSGISTLLGIIPTYLNLKYKDKIINYTLSFSAGTMITLSLFSLIIESLNILNNLILVLIFLFLGIFISIIIDKLISLKTSNNLYKVGIVSLFALILHNIPEGIITFISTNNNMKLGLALSLGIALHNIPEGIAIAVPLYHSGTLYSLTAGIMLQIAINEELNEALTYNNKKITLQGFILGSIIMLICIYYFKL